MCLSYWVLSSDLWVVDGIQKDFLLEQLFLCVLNTFCDSVSKSTFFVMWNRCITKKSSVELHGFPINCNELFVWWLVRSINASIDWSIGFPIDWCIDSSFYRSLDRLIDWLIAVVDRLMYWLLVPLIGWLIGWLVDSFIHGEGHCESCWLTACNCEIWQQSV